MSNLFLTKFDTPIGEMIAGADDSALLLLEFTDTNRHLSEINQICKFHKLNQISAENAIIKQTISQMYEYFDGKRTSFDIPIKFTGTDFQKSVWDLLSKIEYGTTISYKTEAEILNNPTAIRAVANANGKNKISIIIPCHRVIGSSGNLSGYGGGVHRKEYLINLEKSFINSTKTNQ